MKRTPRMSALGLLVAATLGAAATGCTTKGAPESTQASTTTTSAPATDPPAEDQVVWQEFTGGGFVPAEYAAGNVPQVTIYADGRTFVSVVGFGGAAARPVELVEATVPAADLDAFIDDATTSGLFDPGTDFGMPGVTDLPSTSVTLRSGGPPQQVYVYALDLASDPPVEGVSAAQQVRRNELRDLLERARTLAVDGEPFIPRQVRATMFDPATGADPPTEATPWPGLPFTSFPEPVGAGGTSCLVIEGDDASVVYAAARENPEQAWSSDGEVRTIVIAPLLPGQEGCPPS